MKKLFQDAAQKTSEAAGSVITFLVASSIIIIWAIIGPLMNFSNTWQLIISTISSVVTFLMVFLIQYAQNKDTKAIHLKLDELIRTSRKARDSFVNIEEKPDEVLDTEMQKFDKLAKDKEKDANVR